MSLKSNAINLRCETSIYDGLATRHRPREQVCAGEGWQAEGERHLSDWIGRNTDSLFLSAITVVEVVAGIQKLRRAGAARRATDLQTWLDRILGSYDERILALNTEAAKVAGILADRAQAIGHNPGQSDILIAATAEAHGHGLMTNNTKHFAPLNLSVPLLNPFEQALPGKVLACVRRVRCGWVAVALERMLEPVFEAEFMLPWSFSEETAAEKHMARLQHNMRANNFKSAALSIIAGGGKWVEIIIRADPLYQHFLLTAERKFWRCVESGDPPRPFGVEPPKPRIEAVRIVDMGESNSWPEFAGLYRSTRAAFLEHERAKSELKALMPEDAKEAAGHGIRAKRSKSGTVSFDVVAMEESHAAVQ